MLYIFAKLIKIIVTRFRLSFSEFWAEIGSFRVDQGSPNNWFFDVSEKTSKKTLILMYWMDFAPNLILYPRVSIVFIDFNPVGPDSGLIPIDGKQIFRTQAQLNFRILNSLKFEILLKRWWFVCLLCSAKTTMSNFNGKTPTKGWKLKSRRKKGFSVIRPPGYSKHPKWINFCGFCGFAPKPQNWIPAKFFKCEKQRPNNSQNDSKFSFKREIRKIKFPQKSQQQ